MNPDPKSPTPAPTTPSVSKTEEVKGIRIFSYPKVIFLFPTLVVALICWAGMLTIGDSNVTQRKAEMEVKAQTGVSPTGRAVQVAEPATKHDRFKTPENLLGILFLGVLAFNLLMMALDFPRFTIVAIIFLIGFAVFFILWLGAYFDYELMRAVRKLMASIYVFANAEFYFLVAVMLTLIFLVVYITRWLDYWQILPNEILHHHGPLSDLEQFKTTSLKFDKEIPDVLEYMLLGSGRLVLHIPDEKKAVVLDNVLFINSVERSLKKIMSRMEVRITTDQESAEL
jgi:hypothetical protein